MLRHLSFILFYLLHSLNLLLLLLIKQGAIIYRVGAEQHQSLRIESAKLDVNF